LWNVYPGWRLLRSLTPGLLSFATYGASVWLRQIPFRLPTESVSICVHLWLNSVSLRLGGEFRLFGSLAPPFAWFAVKLQFSRQGESVLQVKEQQIETHAADLDRRTGVVEGNAVVALSSSIRHLTLRRNRDD